MVAAETVELDVGGVRADRRFFLIDADARMVNGKRMSSLQTVVADYSDADRTLALRFPGDTVVAGAVRAGSMVQARFFSQLIEAREVLGPFSDALSEHVGAPVRLLESVEDWGATDRGREGAVSLISRASLDRLARAAAAPAPIDARRFRMLFEIDGTDPHEEDSWLGRPLRIGAATVVMRGHVGRCLVTKLDPDTGVADLDTLDLLASYRGAAGTSEPLACGVYGEVIAPGAVSVGDAVELA